MKIYLASRYSRREELCEYRRELESAGHTVTSRWLNGKHQIDASGVPIGDKGEKLVEGDGGADTPEANALRAHFVTEDYQDVQTAELVISFTEPPRSAAGNRGGRHVEFGMAVALNKSLIVVGYRENLFHWLPQVRFYPTWADAVHTLKRPCCSRCGEPLKGDTAIRMGVCELCDDL